MAYTTREIFNSIGPEGVYEELKDRGIDEKIIQAFGDAAHKQNGVDKSGSLEVDIFNAAHALSDSGTTDFSERTLAMLLYRNDWSPGESTKFRRRVGFSLETMFSGRAGWLSSRYDLSISPIHVLRQNVGAYSGNLYEAREKGYDVFQASEPDFARSIRLPLQEGDKLDAETSFFIGTYLATGNVFFDKKGPLRIVVRANKSNTGYTKKISDIIAEIFNIKDCYKETLRLRPNSGDEYVMPYLQINSRAVSSWLSDEAGIDRKDIDYSKMDALDMRGVVSGFVSSRGTLSKTRGTIRIGFGSKKMLGQVKYMLHEEGIETGKLHNNYRSAFFEIKRSSVDTARLKLDLRNDELR